MQLQQIGSSYKDNVQKTKKSWWLLTLTAYMDLIILKKKTM